MEVFVLKELPVDINNMFQAMFILKANVASSGEFEINVL